MRKLLSELRLWIQSNLKCSKGRQPGDTYFLIFHEFISRDTLLIYPPNFAIRTLGQRPITPCGIARLLEGFGVKPTKFRTAGYTPGTRGYGRPD